MADGLSEGLWRAVMLTAVDPIIVIDDSGTMLEVNPATAALFGYEDAELVGRNVSMLMAEPQRSEHDGYIAGFLDTGEAKVIGVGREVSARRSDGTTLPISLAVSEVVTPTGCVFAGVVHDLTGEREAQELLRNLNAELEQRVAERTVALEASLTELARSNRDLEQFAYIASHDLQAPLRNVRQGLELLDAHLTETIGSSFDADAEELRDLIFGAVDRMEALIHGLLAYARVERRRQPADGTVDLNAVVADVLAELSLQEGDVAVDRLPTVKGDPTQLHQLLQNLIENAVKYRLLSRPPEITISDRSDHDHWRISVTDNGIGIAPEHHDRIFELFRRGHPGYDGVGLGLAICQRIIERHGGKISVDSEPERGATFTFTLPRGPASTGP